jgi:hypothetical protein
MTPVTIIPYRSRPAIGLAVGSDDAVPVAGKVGGAARGGELSSRGGRRAARHAHGARTERRPRRRLLLNGRLRAVRRPARGDRGGGLIRCADGPAASVGWALPGYRLL